MLTFRNFQVANSPIHKSCNSRSKKENLKSTHPLQKICCERQVNVLEKLYSGSLNRLTAQFQGILQGSP